MEKLIIDPEFRDKIPPLTEDEFSLLEENILSDGAVVSPLIVWDGVILDGHNRYEIIQKHPELTYAVHKKSFSNRFEALSWICKNQLGRRNLTPQQKKYLIGQRYEAEKQADAFHGNQHTASDESGAVQIEPHQNGRHVTVGFMIAVPMCGGDTEPATATPSGRTRSTRRYSTPSVTSFRWRLIMRSS